MKNTISGLLLLGIVSSCAEVRKTENTATLNYPETKKVDQIDTYFGTEVKDPYRWLEDDHSKETKDWVVAENKLTFSYLNQIAYRDSLEKRLTALWDYEKIGAPFKKGDFTYFYKNDGLQNQYVIYRYKTDENPESAEVFLNPNTFSKEMEIIRQPDWQL